MRGKTIAAVFAVLALAAPSSALAAGSCLPAESTTSYGTPTKVLISSEGESKNISTLGVGLAGEFITDVNVETKISHTWSQDLDVSLTSPDGTIVQLTTDNGSEYDDVFKGTSWDDDADPGSEMPSTFNQNQVTEHSYTDKTTATPLLPEEPLAAFNGENPAGNWTLTVADDSGGAGGALELWWLYITTLPSAPTLATVGPFANMTTLPISDSGTPVVTSTVQVSGAGDYLADLEVFTKVAHGYNPDLDIALTSPAGTVVTLTTDNGGSFVDDLFKGTVWDDDLDPGTEMPVGLNERLVIDHAPLTIGGIRPALVPEQALGAFAGEDPNGTWTLTVVDDDPGEGGTLEGWSLTPTTACTPPPPKVTNPTPTGGAGQQQQAQVADRCPPLLAALKNAKARLATARKATKGKRAKVRKARAKLRKARSAAAGC